MSNLRETCEGRSSSTGLSSDEVTLLHTPPKGEQSFWLFIGQRSVALGSRHRSQKLESTPSKLFRCNNADGAFDLSSGNLTRIKVVRIGKNWRDCEQSKQCLVR